MKPSLRRPRGSAAGFTLAELMVVIVIIGLLATLVVPNVLGKLNTANSAKAKADIVQLENAVNEYAIQNNGRFPDSLESLVIENENGDKLLNYDTVPKDPWKNEYQYTVDNDKGFTITSYGADGQPGGEGKNRDIDNHTIRSDN